MKYHPHPYQVTAERWILEHPRCALFMDMGLGKTVCTLTALSRLMDDCEVERTLVVAPKKVAETTWSTEASKWDHLQSMRVTRVMGTERKRIAALEEKSDVYVVGRDSFVWLVSRYGGRLPFDALIIDELTSFKNHGSARFKAMRVASAGMRRIVGLTGTPAPNCLVDLWAQMYCIDQGERLGKSVTRYRDAYFSQYRWNHITVRCEAKPGADEAIRRKIADICLSMKAGDYLQLPDLMVHTVDVCLCEKAMAAYRKFERDRVLELVGDGKTATSSVTAGSAAGLMNKLGQYCNGALYDDSRGVIEVHSDKLAALKEIVEASGGHGILVFYQYLHDIPRIEATLKGYRLRTYTSPADLDAWNSGHIDVLLAHPASTAYGLNMQAGGHYIVWFGLTWNLELYMQANARLHRQGQQHPVMVYLLVAHGTVDELARQALERKRGVQEAMMDGLSQLMRRIGITHTATEKEDEA